METRLQSTFWTLLWKLTTPFFGAVYLFEGDLSRQRPSFPPPPGFLVRLYRGEADLRAAIDVLVPTGLAAADIAARLQRGDLAAVGFIGDQAVAYTWASFSEARVRELAMNLRARADEAIQYETLVLRPFRRHGLQFAVAKPVLDYLQEHGYARTLAWVNVFNRPSCKNQWKWGKRVRLTALSLRIPGIRRRWNFSLGAPLDSLVLRAEDNPRPGPTPTK
jgi:hypothetical protein